MAYNDVTSRADATALIPEQAAQNIIQDLPGQSAVFALATKLPNMSRGQLRMPVLQNLPIAYFRNPTDTGISQTTDQTWENKYITAEELVVTCPIPKTVMEDSDFDMWGEIKPRLVEAIGAAVDAAVLKGTNAPASWPTDIKTAATAAGQTISLANFADLYDAILSAGGACDLVESDGFDVSGHLAVPGMKSKFRGMRDSDGSPIFSTAMQQANTYYLDGNPVTFANNGAVTSADFLEVCGAWRKLVYSVRRDIEFIRLDQGVITDNAGAVVFNLPQQGMVALQVTMRLGWQLPNPPNRVNANAATRYPFAVLTA